jgi:hypothetical protein
VYWGRVVLQSKIGRNFLISFILLNLIVGGLFVFAVLKRPDLLHALPGEFGPNLSPDLSGNMLFLALLLLVNAALFMIFGLGGTWHAMWAGLRIRPSKLRWLLHERSGLASDISGVVAEAIQEEEKSELGYLGTARGLLTVGLLLTVLSLPALCIAYSKAAPTGNAIFETTGTAMANSAVSQDTVLRFTGDQLAGALLLDVPEVFHLRATPVETNGANLIFAILILLYRAVVGFGVLVWFVAARRIGSLRTAAMEVAMPAADIVAMEPVLQDGHGHHDPHHHESEHHEPAPHDHGHHDDHHGHDDHAHDDHGHSDHGHESHGHEDHGHDSGHHDDHHGNDSHHDEHAGHGDHHDDENAHSSEDHHAGHDDHGGHGHSDSHSHHHDGQNHGHDGHHADAHEASHRHKVEESV